MFIIIYVYKENKGYIIINLHVLLLISVIKKNWIMHVFTNLINIKKKVYLLLMYLSFFYYIRKRSCSKTSKDGRFAMMII